MFIANQHPLETFDSCNIEHVSQYPRNGLDTFDAGENYFFRRELQYIIPEMVLFEYARIHAREVFPLDMRAGPAAEVIRFRQITRTGAAKIITDYANDIPLANAFAEEFTGNVRSIAEAAQWSVQEIRASNQSGRQLDRDKTEAAREDMLRLENSIAFIGDAVNGLAGLMTDTNIPRTTVPIGVSTNTEWSTKTGAEIVSDMNLIVNQISETTGQVEAPDTLLLPTAQYNQAITTRMETGTDTTALMFFVNNSPYIKTINDVVSVNELKGIGTAGVDVMVAYEKSASKLQMNIPLDIEQFQPQHRDMVMRIIYHMRTGGVTIKKPLSLHIGEAI